MTITLWGRLSSGNVQKVVWALEELELPYTHVPLGGAFKGNDTPEYLGMNPNGLVPTLRDGDAGEWRYCREAGPLRDMDALVGDRKRRHRLEGFAGEEVSVPGRNARASRAAWLIEKK